MLVKPTKDATFTISERLRIHTIQESRKRIHSICSTPKENTVCLHDAAKITNETKRLKVKKNLERRISAMISKKYSEKNCIRFVKRLKRERMTLFTFLQTGTDYHNNTAERAIRPNVIIRKITNGHRSKAGADSHKILMSIKETCRMRGLNFHDYVLEYLRNSTSKR